MVSSNTTQPAILYEDVFASATILQCFAIGPLRHDEDDTAASRTGFDTVAKRRWYFLSAANNTESLYFTLLPQQSNARTLFSLTHSALWNHEMCKENAT